MKLRHSPIFLFVDTPNDSSYASRTLIAVDSVFWVKQEWRSEEASFGS